MRDDGVGIPEKDVDRVFDKGFTGENGRRFGRSTGLGLYLCKKLCTKLGLGLRISSKLGEGVLAEIVFPKGEPL
jgi:signal transduction histidine kinase